VVEANLETHAFLSEARRRQMRRISSVLYHIPIPAIRFTLPQHILPTLPRYNYTTLIA